MASERLKQVSTMSRPRLHVSMTALQQPSCHTADGVRRPAQRTALTACGRAAVSPRVSSLVIEKCRPVVTERTGPWECSSRSCPRSRGFARLGRLVRPADACACSPHHGRARRICCPSTRRPLTSSRAHAHGSRPSLPTPGESCLRRVSVLLLRVLDGTDFDSSCEP